MRDLKGLTNVTKGYNFKSVPSFLNFWRKDPSRNQFKKENGPF